MVSKLRTIWKQTKSKLWFDAAAGAVESALVLQKFVRSRFAGKARMAGNLTKLTASSKVSAHPPPLLQQQPPPHLRLPSERAKRTSPSRLPFLKFLKFLSRRTLAVVA